MVVLTQKKTVERQIWYIWSIATSGNTSITTLSRMKYKSYALVVPVFWESRLWKPSSAASKSSTLNLPRPLILASVTSLSFYMRFPVNCRSFGDLAKLSRNQRMDTCLVIMDPPYKIFKTFYLNHPKLHVSRDGPTGQRLCHIQNVRTPIHDTIILEWVKFLVINQLYMINLFIDSVQLQKIMYFL